MICPKCKAGEIEAAGSCPCCGHSTVKVGQMPSLPFPPPERVVSFPPLKPKKATEKTAHLRVVKERPIPSWRLEVSQKVQEVLRSRGAKAGAGSSTGTSAPAVSGPQESGRPALPPEPTAGVPAREEALAAPSATPVSPAPAAAARPPQIRLKDSGPGPLFAGTAKELTRAHAPRREEPPPPPRLNEPAPPPVPSRPQIHLGPEALELELETEYAPPVVSADPPASPPDLVPDRGVLLSRTLAGLIDFIVLLFSSIPFFFTLVYLFGYEEIDDFTLLVLLGVCIALYVLYSVFFLSFSGQTIGMMITDLQVVTVSGSLPGWKRALGRILGFGFSMGLCGVGLLWGLVDRQSRCLHDLLSKTLVIRVLRF